MRTGTHTFYLSRSLRAPATLTARIWVSFCNTLVFLPSFAVCIWIRVRERAPLGEGNGCTGTASGWNSRRQTGKLPPGWRWCLEREGERKNISEKMCDIVLLRLLSFQWEGSVGTEGSVSTRVESGCVCVCVCVAVRWMNVPPHGGDGLFCAFSPSKRNDLTYPGCTGF